MSKTHISIHAPAKGATNDSRLSWTLKNNFNPRSREGSDYNRSAVTSCNYKISIHAPAKGATEVFLIASATIRISIHAPAKGATGNIVRIRAFQEFQSTLPRRERHNGFLCACQYIFNFNPRSREGSDMQQALHTLRM